MLRIILKEEAGWEMFKCIVGSLISRYFSSSTLWFHLRSIKRLLLSYDKNAETFDPLEIHILQKIYVKRISELFFEAC